MKAAPILALHGNLGSGRDWERLGVPGLRAVELWGYVSLSFREMAGELATTLSEGKDRPVIAGYSLGGRLALHAMAIHPERWGGAVIVSAHPGLRDFDARADRLRQDEAWSRKARELPWDEFLREWNQQAIFGGDGGAGGRQGNQKRESTCPETRRTEIVRAFRTWSLGRQEDLRPALRGFQAPVLWITGERDGKFSRLGAEMADVFPDFQHVILSGVGHRALEDVAGCGAVVQRWRGE